MSYTWRKSALAIAIFLSLWLCESKAFSEPQVELEMPDRFPHSYGAFMDFCFSPDG